MKFALDVATEVGQRTARILLSDDRCDALVMLNSGWRPDDKRVVRSKDLTDVAVVISDGATALSNLIGSCSVAQVPLVVWPDAAATDIGPASIPVIVGANVGSTLVDALGMHPACARGPDDEVRAAWTEPGKPLRRGTPIGFPEPVGMAWTESRSTGRFVAYRHDEWAAATTIVEGPSGRRTVGVADHGPHIEALTLTAVALVATEGAFSPGIQTTDTQLPLILSEAQNLELDVAVWRSHS